MPLSVAPKILVIRYSSIGDIVLTTPVIRCLKQQLNAEIHVLTKGTFVDLFTHNPHITAVYSREKIHWKDLKNMGFDRIIDLQKNRFSIWLCLKMGVPFNSFDKLNFQKWLLVYFKVNFLPKKHLVDRYFESLLPLGIQNDGLGCDYFINDKQVSAHVRLLSLEKYDIIVLGAAHGTKRISLQKCKEILGLTSKTVLLVGGKDVLDMAAEVQAVFPQVINRVGLDNLDESAFLIKHAEMIYTGDTGMMHIAAAFQKKVVVLWGNTVPAFGMFPYYGKQNVYQSIWFQNEKISCRPCSKLGYTTCPKGHFKCMEDVQLDINEIQSLAHDSM